MMRADSVTVMLYEGCTRVYRGYKEYIVIILGYVIQNLIIRFKAIIMNGCFCIEK